jgi:predicted acetyltransferase
MATLTTTPHLVQPTDALRATFLEAMREHAETDGRPDAGGLTLADLEDGDCVACYTEGLRDGTAMRPGTRPMEGCEWWLVEPGRDGLTYLGRVSLYLNPGPRQGHLELAVRPSRRRQGHGARLLRLGLDLAHERGIGMARLVCWEGAQAARALIESAGGVLANRIEGGCFYRIDTGQH